MDKENTSVSFDGVDVKMKRAFVKLPSQNIGEDFKDSDEVLTNKNLIFEDSSDLPYGWSRFKERRLNSAHYDRCILTSCGTRIDRQKKLDEFISLKALDLNISFSGSGRETLGAAMKSDPPPGTTDQGAKRKLVQQDISSFMKTDSASVPDRDPPGPLTKKFKSNVVGVLAKGVSHQEMEKTPLEISAPETDVDCDKESSQDWSAVATAGDDSAESFSQTAESSGNIVSPSDEITPEVTEDLPTGWTRKQISKAFRKNETIVVVLTPDGKQFDCQKKLNSYIARNKLNIKVSIDGPFQTLESKKESEVKPSAEEKAEVEESEKKEKRKVKKERTAETNGALTNKEVDEDEEKEELTEDELNYISEIKKFLKANKLALSPTPPTKGDGNCWFRAVAEQVEFHGIPDRAKNYRSLRLEVCNHLRHLPEDIQQNMIDVVFLGKKRGLSDLASRQRKDGQWVDNTGVMVLATALYLARNIHLYSYASTTTNEVSLTKIDGGEKASDSLPITIFFYDRHYQTLRPTN